MRRLTDKPQKMASLFTQPRYKRHLPLNPKVQKESRERERDLATPTSLQTTTRVRLNEHELYTPLSKLV